MADLERIIEIIKNGLAGPQALTAQAFIFDLTKENFQLQTRIRELEQQCLRFKKDIEDSENWEKEKSLYEVHYLGSKTVSFRKAGTEEIFCAPCFTGKKIAIHLQNSPDRRDHLFCPSCKTTYKPW